MPRIGELLIKHLEQRRRGFDPPYLGYAATLIRPKQILVKAAYYVEDEGRNDFFVALKTICINLKNCRLKIIRFDNRVLHYT